MNLEQLQAMTDEELNELSAVKVMGWEKTKVNRVVRVWASGSGEQKRNIDNWNPTNDMKDAMELYKSLSNPEKNSFIKHMLSFSDSVSKHELTTWDIVEMLKLPIKYWVIASILAKGE